MATGFTDFSEYTTDEKPSDWTYKLDAVAGASVVADGAATGGKVLRFNPSYSSSALFAISWDEADALSDRDNIEILARFRTNVTNNNQHFHIAGRGSGTGFANATYYSAAVLKFTGSNNQRLFKRVSGTATALATSASTFTQNEWRWARLRCNGTTIQGKHWIDGDAEPGSWTFSEIDSSITGTGFVGLIHGAFTSSSTYNCDIDFFSYGSGGDTAPTSADVTAPILSSPSGTATGPTTANLSVTTDEANGTLYRVVTTSATAPSVAQVQAGQDHTGVAAAFSGSATVTVTGAQASTATGLTASTGYYPHFQHRDAASNDSTVASGALFTTTSGATPVAFTGTVPTQNLTESVAMTPLDLSTYFSGTETPFAYAVHTGTLQTGLSLNASTGVISGTPSEVATRAIVVRATDDATNTADTNSFDIVVAAAAVKGLRVRLYDGATAQASLTGISVAMWAAQDFDATAPDFYTATATTDADGWLEVNVNAVGGVALNDLVYTVVWKRDTVTVADSLGFQGVLTVSDIS